MKKAFVEKVERKGISIKLVTYNRLTALSENYTDSPDDVINRLIDIVNGLRTREKGRRK